MNLQTTREVASAAAAERNAQPAWTMQRGGGYGEVVSGPW